MFKDIIVGISLTGIDDCAMKLATELAEKFEANLYPIHVAGMEQGWGSIQHLEHSGETERLKKQLEERYSLSLEKLPNSEVMVVPGIPHNELLRLARKKKTDLIVMGPHTKEYEEKRSHMWGMAGSTLERVSQKARCPILIIRKDVVCKEPLFERILVATDFSKQAECAINYGGQLARQYNAQIKLINVTEEESQNAESMKRLKGEYEARLRGVKECGYEVCSGEAAVEILHIAQESNTDLIVMAHHSKEQDPEKAFLGSTVTQVALNAPCPTMSVNHYFDLRCGLMYDQSGQVIDG
ncbi:universal stress protein [Halodesulfovibrio aestuarii]|uniref:Universal stress protein n=1 Tax=Halodesulfovibrio aestuarii TaxID=126333 RepID=A0ABV4JVV3_9BACT